MPYTRKTKLYYPKKGSAEAKAWAEKMRKVREAKKPKLTESQKRHKRLYGKYEYGRIW